MYMYSYEDKAYGRKEIDVKNRQVISIGIAISADCNCAINWDSYSFQNSHK